MTQKQFYESPSAELLVVRFEESIMSAKYGSAGAPGGSLDEEDYGDF